MKSIAIGVVVSVVIVVVFNVDVAASASVCSNPSHYAGQSLCDPWGTYCGECVSFVKVCTGKNFGFEPGTSWS